MTFRNSRAEFLVMKSAGFGFLILTCSVASVVSAAEISGAPMALSVEPKAGVPGTVLTVKGTSLEKQRVDEVYLTDHRFDMMVKVIEQTPETMKIRIPPFAKPGRLQLLFLTAGTKPVYLEQPFYVEIMDKDDAPVTAPVVVTSNAAPVPAPVPASAGAAAVAVATPVAAPPVQAQTTQPAVQPVEVAAAAIQQNTAPAPKPVAAPPIQWARAEPVAAEISGNLQLAPLPAVQLPPPAAKAAVVQQAAAPKAVTVPAVPSSVPTPTAAIPAPQVASGRTPARVLKRSPVYYPATAKTMRREGPVDVLITIGTNGKVMAAKAVSGDPLLRTAAEHAAEGWTFEPARVNSGAVESQTNVTINFKLSN